MKHQLLSILVFFICSGTISAQFPEGFEGQNFPPEGWTIFDNDIGTGYNWQLSDDAYSGTGSAFIRWENVDEGIAADWLVTPRFEPSQNAHILSFYQKDSYARDYFSEYTVRVSVASQDDPEDFVVIDHQNEPDMRLYFTYHEVDLSAYINQQIYVAFVMTNDDGDNWIIDDVTLTNCDRPQGLYAANNTSNGADLFWENDGADHWSLEVVPIGTIPTGIPDYDQITEIPFQWQGGEAFNQYTFYLQSHCTDGAHSNYSAPSTFLTTCDNNSCDYLFVLEDSYGDDWNGAWIEIRQKGISVGQITQEERGFGPYDFYFSFCDTLPFELIWHSGNWDQECIFSFYDLYDQKYFSFKAGDAPENNEVFYSGIADCDPVTCRFPYDVVIADYTVNGAMIDWVDNNAIGLWDIEIVPHMDEPNGQHIITNIDTKPFVWTGGEAGTYYDVYVRAVCDSDDRSKWSPSGTFATLCDQVYDSYPFYEDFIGDYALPECWSMRHNGAGDYSWKTKADYFTEDTLVYCRHDNEKQDEWLISPAFDLSGAQDEVIISFDWKMSYYWMVYPYDKGDLNVRVSMDKGNHWSEVLWNEAHESQFPSFEWQHSEINLSAYRGEAELWIAFQFLAEDAATVYLDNFMIDDGTGSITDVEELESADKYTLFPNPANSKLTIKGMTSDQDAFISIIDVNGKVVSEYYPKGKTINRLDISKLMPGIYFLNIQDDSGSVCRKFVKM